MISDDLYIKMFREKRGVVVSCQNDVITIATLLSAIAVTRTGAWYIYEKLGEILGEEVEKVEEATAQARTPGRHSRAGIGYGIAYARPGLAASRAQDGHAAAGDGQGTDRDLGDANQRES
jgi:hypothetical protein